MRQQDDRIDGAGAVPPPTLGPLPARHSYTPEQVARHQRERLIAGLAAAVAEHGYAAVGVGQIAAAAHVSRRSFYDHFADKEECFLAAFDALAEHLRALSTKAAAAHPGDWAAGLLAGLRAALEFLAAEPDLARLLLVDSLSAGPALRRRFGEIAESYAPYLARDDEAGEREAALVGGLGFQLSRQVAAEGAESLLAHLAGYAEYLLTPYLGAERAHRLAATVEGGPR